MAEYKLKILPLFERDLNEIADYISGTLKNPSAANRLINDIEIAIKKRLPNAESFAPYPTHQEHPNPYYAIYVRNFVVFYVVIDDTMEVRRVVYKRRDMLKLI